MNTWHVGWQLCKVIWRRQNGHQNSTMTHSMEQHKNKKKDALIKRGYQQWKDRKRWLRNECGTWHPSVAQSNHLCKGKIPRVTGGGVLRMELKLGVCSQQTSRVILFCKQSPLSSLTPLNILSVYAVITCASNKFWLLCRLLTWRECADNMDLKFFCSLDSDLSCRVKREIPGEHWALT